MNQTYIPQTIAKINIVGYNSPYQTINSRFNLNKSSYNTLNPKNSEQRNFGVIEAAFWLIIGGLIGGAIVGSYKRDLDNRAKEIHEKSKGQSNTSSLDSSLQENEVTEEDKGALVSLLAAKLKYGPNSQIKEGTEKGEYSKKDYLELEAELREKDIEVDEEGKEIYETSQREEISKENYEGGKLEEGIRESSDKNPDSEEANLDEGAADEAEPPESEGDE